MESFDLFLPYCLFYIQASQERISLVICRLKRSIHSRQMENVISKIETKGKYEL